MRISELIVELERIRQEHGDIYVENENGVTVEVSWSNADGVVVAVIT